jgi:hypothetical protein
VNHQFNGAALQEGATGSAPQDRDYWPNDALMIGDDVALPQLDR